MQGAYKGLGSNRIRSNKEEVISNKQKAINKEEEEEEVISKTDVVIKYEDFSAADSAEGFKNTIKIFQENIHAITPLEYEKILEFTKHVTNEVIIMAIEEAVNYNAKTMKYISKILNSWISNGIKTADEVRAYQKKWTDKKTSNLSQNVKKGGFCDYEQRTYDFDALEKKLLGYEDTEDLE
ncbi:DnaD domain-containing protein [Clostridium sp.]|uniref:DnaD domain-containing protein n=1 Tax=Clostridium sp. TaxID=1506 RepID=UPI003D6D9401